MLAIRRFRKFAIVLGALLTLPIVAHSQTAAEHIALGDQEQAAFRPAAAVEHYEAAIALEPNNSVALGKASRSTVDVGEQTTDAAARKALFLKGEQFARSAVAANPNDAEAHFHLARALGRAALSVGVRERVRYATEIRAEALEALRLDPDHPGALHVMSVWNAEIMRLNGIQRFFAKNVLGGRTFGEANWNEAISYMQRAIAVDPDRLAHHLDLAQIYVDVGDKAKAREAFEFVVRGKQTDFNDPVYKREAEEALRALK